MMYRAASTLALAASTLLLSSTSAAPAGEIAPAPRALEKRWPAGSVAPKVVIISMFSYEQVWDEPLALTQNITIPGASPLYPNVTCNSEYSICHIITGEAEINAASTLMALVLNPIFDLTSSYFFIGGIAGISPYCGTLGSVNFARFTVQVALSYEVDARQKPENFTSGYYLQGTDAPGQVTTDIYGTEVFELNTNLLANVFEITKGVTLNDSTTAQAYRATFGYAPANQPPSIVPGVVATSDVYFYGSLLSEAFANNTLLWTGGGGPSAEYCTTAQEDNATLESLIRGAHAGLLDFSRIILMRTASDMDRAPPGVDENVAFNAEQGGFEIALENIYIAGRPVVDAIVNDWDATYKKGIAPQANFTMTADDLDSLDIETTYTTRKRSLQAAKEERRTWRSRGSVVISH